MKKILLGLAAIGALMATRLAEKYKDTRITIATEGFGPQPFAPIEVASRSSTNKR